MESSLEDRLWDSMFRDGQKLLRSGQHAAALKEFQGAVNLSAKFEKGDPRRLQSLSGLALTYVMRQEFAEAEPFFKQAVDLLSATQGADDLEVARLLKHLALVYSNQRKYDQASEVYQRAIKIMEKSSPGHSDISALKVQLEKVKKQGEAKKRAAQEADELIVIMEPRRKSEGEGNGKRQAAAASQAAGSEPKPASATAPIPNDNPVGHVLDNRYTVIERLAAGGMSVIYKARHNHLDRVVAIKIMHPHLMKHERNMQRFTQEAKLASGLTHQNIVTVRDFGITSDGLCYIVMDLVEGETLAQRINRLHHLPPGQFIEFACQIADALAYAHDQHLLHRDLKPSNIMLDTSGSKEVAKIVDFGIAKVVDKGEEALALTQTGETVGSPLYMSPEQCRGRALDVRSDIYSFGCLSYKTLSGFPPFMGATDIDVYFRHINDAPSPIRTANPYITLPEALEKAVMQSLEKDPDKRQQSMRELKAQLEAIKL